MRRYVNVLTDYLVLELREEMAHPKETASTAQSRPQGEDVEKVPSH